MGRLLNFFITGTADKSKVYLVYVSKVLMPLSQRINSTSPFEVIYSAVISHSLMVAAQPLFNMTFLLYLFATIPTFLSNAKLDMFLVPICKISAYFATSSTV